ncbi:hypothetical protein ROJ8625_03865 [Roseivivax jejudonensis]|uniref:Formate dehydrogenase region TAT target n=1 Tax=Roseivivax jejudonensis TaxID=1529041 RepID=A0A1X7A7M9_9RHOB|nr:twin-arginine translocation signal domain-containing protein [Roseivivax jejudonensis]SLN72670.1 hypothetical protein ROJ8625_03865 [Roseivivax jejudonensis]
MSDKTETDTGRRSFLKLATTAAPAALAAAAVARPGDAEAAEAEGPHKGLADTAHTRAYFDSARF